MASILKVDTIQDQSGNNIINENADTITIGASGDTITVPTGASLTVPNGGLSGQNYPAFFARLSANQGVGNNASSKAQCNTEILDTDNCYDNSVNYRFTPNVAGKYFVFGQIGFNTGTNNSVQLAVVAIKKNGSTIQYNQFDFRTNYAGQQNMVMSHGIVDMNGTTDYLELFGEIYVVAGSTYEFGGSASNNSTSFGAYRIGV